MLRLGAVKLPTLVANAIPWQLPAIKNNKWARQIGHTPRKSDGTVDPVKPRTSQGRWPKTWFDSGELFSLPRLGTASLPETARQARRLVLCQSASQAGQLQKPARGAKRTFRTPVLAVWLIRDLGGVGRINQEAQGMTIFGIRTSIYRFARACARSLTSPSSRATA